MNIKELAKYIEENFTEEEIRAYIKNVEALKARYKEEAELNNQGIRLEKEGKTGEAILIYEGLLDKNFAGSHPYDRLIVLYNKLKQKDAVLRVLEKAVYVFENVVPETRPDRARKLERYRNKLEKAKSS